jgi:hypothetical protein
MGIKLGNTAISKVYLGETEINKIYLGSSLIHEIEYIPPAPTLIPEVYGAAAYPDATGILGGSWVGDNITMETTITRHGTTAIRFTPADPPNVNTQTRTNAFLPSGYATGKTYRLSGYSYYIDGTQNRIGQYDATTGIVRPDLSTTSGWQYFEFDFTAGQSSGYRIYFYGDGNYIIDDLELIELP